MKIGLAYDLKDEVSSQCKTDDALEEYDSIETIEGIAGVLQSLGHSTVKLGGGRQFLHNISNTTVDFVFNISEGRGTFRSRDAQVPSILELLDIPYTGADPQCLAICLDKPLVKRIVKSYGIITPKWQIVESIESIRNIAWKDMSYPLILKPAYEGSSKGIRFTSIVNNKEETIKILHELLLAYQQPIMLEEYIEGDEITVGVIGNAPAEIVGVMRVLPKKKYTHFVYSLEVKRDWVNTVEYEVPAKLDEKIMNTLINDSLMVYKLLECRDFGRIDFRIDKKGVPYFIEINPLAGLNPRSSDLPIMARKMNIDYEKLVAAIFNAALRRYESTKGSNCL